jgi:cytidyltransferase-like protein
MIERIGIISGYFNPIHLGHLDYIEAAARRCDTLCVIVNNDTQVALKGSCPFYDETTRVALVGRQRNVSNVFLSIDEDNSVAKSIERIYRDVIRTWRPPEANISYSFTFFNGGDRTPDNWNQSEIDVCQKYSIDLMFLPMKKVDASSEIIRKAAQWYESLSAIREEIYANAIRKHRDFRGDDRCHHDDTELYQILPEGYTPPEMDTAVELENCKKFIECRQNPATQYVSPQRRIEMLECLVKKYEKILGFASVIKAVRDHCEPKKA